MKIAEIISGINMVKVKTYAPFGLLGLVILVEVWFLAFYLPGKIFGLLELRDQVTRLSQDVGQLATANEQLGAVDNTQLAAELTVAEVALPDEKKVAGLISGLGSLASSSGVLVKSIAFSPGRVSTSSADLTGGGSEIEVGDKVRAIPVTMTVTSSLEQFLDYLERLEAASQLLGVTEINYSLSGPTGGDLGLLVYYLPARTGKPSWQHIPSISSEDLAVLSKVSPLDIFNLPAGPR